VALYANPDEEAEGTESQDEKVDDPPATRARDLGSNHRELNPGAAWLHQTYFGHQLYAGNEAVDGVATQAFTPA